MLNIIIFFDFVRATCALEDSNAGYLLACACNGVDISASVYAQVKAENQMVDI
jgi:hypothetical protein